MTVRPNEHEVANILLLNPYISEHYQLVACTKHNNQKR
ncbi:hypothetical protein J540_0732 [Acinetobacter baumannii 1440422]|nr:hypothetical protein J540_0732 [Acinetobacter baumannii 1440422]